MQDVLFCPKCGKPNQPDFKFCTSCGFALSTISKATPENTSPEKISLTNVASVQKEPAAVVATAKAGPVLSRQVSTIIAIVILAVIGFLIWNNEQSKNKNTFGNESGLTQNEKKIGGNGIPVTNPSDYIKVEDF